MSEQTRPASGSGEPPQDQLLAGSHHLAPPSRSALLEALARVVHPTALVVAAYLLLVGLHHPGGGFAAGLVVGLGLLLRRLAGGPYELGTATRFPPGVLLGGGLSIAAGYAVAGLLVSGDLLHGAVIHVELPTLPAYAVPTSLLFEVGVLMIVVGLALDVLRTLGGEQER